MGRDRRAISWRRAARAVVLACALAMSGAANAQAPAPRPNSWLDASLQVVDTALGAAGGAIDAVWGAAGSAWRTATSFVLPEAPFDYMPERLSDSAAAFVAMMEQAGYQLAAIETGGGILPIARYRFVLAREPSPADHQRATRALARHRETYSGVGALAQRRIMQTLLDLSDQGQFQVTALVVSIRPWPSIRYELTRRDAALEAGERRMLDAQRAPPRPAN